MVVEVLEIEPESSVKAVTALNFWAICPAPKNNILKGDEPMDLANFGRLKEKETSFSGK